MAEQDGDPEVFGIGLENFFVFRNGAIQLALLDKLLRGTEHL